MPRCGSQEDTLGMIFKPISFDPGFYHRFLRFKLAGIRLAS